LDWSWHVPILVSAILDFVTWIQFCIPTTLSSQAP